MLDLPSRKGCNGLDEHLTKTAELLGSSEDRAESFLGKCCPAWPVTRWAQSGWDGGPGGEKPPASPGCAPHTGAAGAHSHGNVTQQPERPQGLYRFDGLVILPFLGKTEHNGLRGAH